MAEAEGLATPLLLAFRDLARPVTDACASPEAMEYFWHRCGWRVSLDDAGLDALNQVLPIGAAATHLEQIADSVAEQYRAGTEPSAGDLAALADAVATLAQALTSFTPSSLSGLTGPLGDPATWEDLAEQLFDTLIEHYLRTNHPVMYLVLLASGCLRYEPVSAASADRVAFLRPMIDWDQPRALLDDPIGALARTYRWGDPAAPLDYERLLDVLGRVLRALGAGIDVLTPGLQLGPGLPAGTAAQIRPDTDALRVTFLRGVGIGLPIGYEIGIDLYPASRAGGTPPDGFVLRPRLIGGVRQTIPIGPDLGLTVSVDASAGDVLGVALFPGSASLVGGDVVAGTAIEIAATTTDPWYLVGTAKTARIELHSPSLRLSLEGTTDEAELRLRLGMAGTAGQPGGRVVIPMDGADAFATASAGSGDLEFTFTSEVIWSSRTGFALGGATVPKIQLPLDIRLGSFRLTNATIALQPGSGGTGHEAYEVRIGTDIAGTIGPVTAVLSGLGFTVTLVPHSRAELQALPPGSPRPALGDLDVALDFAPPTGVGLSVDVPGVITGGGFLGRDPATGRYSGALNLKAKRVDITGLGLLDTRLPGGQPGYALLIALNATFPGIEIGMGFELTGVGGLIAINRRLDVDTLRNRLASGTAGRILAPQDPIRNAPALLADLDAVFPIARGITVVGPTAQLTWAGLVHFDIGIFIELPGPRRIVLLGSAHAEIQRDNRTLLTVRVDVIGDIDLKAETAKFDAVLIDSHLLGILDITGGAAFRLSWGDQPYSVLTLGGFHPAYNPEPVTFPASLTRITMVRGTPKDEVCLRFEGYLAITSNTLQFGASVDALIHSGGFTIHGTISFDALIQFVPFHFQFDIRASVDVSYGSHHLAGLTLTGSLSGPGPVVLQAKVCIELLFFDICFSHTFEIGGAASPAPPLAADLLDILLAELTDAARLRGDGTPDPHVLVRPPAPGASLPVIVPAGTVVWDQRRAPLGLMLDRVGGTPLGAPRQVQASAAVPADGVMDWFAPGQFVDLTDDQALTRPAYERLASGLRLTGTETVSGPSASKALTIREIRLPAGAERERGVIAFPPWLVGGLQPITEPLIGVTSESWTLSTAAGDQHSLTGAQARRLADLSGDGLAVPAIDHIAAFAF